MSYHPTLWRTCRALANERRLACLRAVLSTPGATVGEIAAAAGLPEDQASLCLRALQARGLLHSKRVSRWVRYSPTPDPLVPAAAPILEAVSHALRTRRRSSAQLIRLLTAFTHPRRLTILRVLQLKRACAFVALARACDISQTALFRHLTKLRERGLVAEADQRWALAQARDPLADALLALAQSRTPEEPL
jgi:DNA-binding transcriptional ArsR family regulator